MKVYRDPLPKMIKHVIFLVVTVNGKGDNPRYLRCFCQVGSFVGISGMLTHLPKRRGDMMSCVVFLDDLTPSILSEVISRYFHKHSASSVKSYLQCWT